MNDCTESLAGLLYSKINYIDGSEMTLKSSLSGLILGIACASLVSVPAFAQKAQKITPPLVQKDANFGSAVAANTQYSFIAAPLANRQGEDSGTVYQYESTTGKFIREILPKDLAAGDHFGTSLAANDKYILIGAPLNDTANTNTGAAYLFDVNTGALVQKFIPVERARASNFGQSVAINANKAVIGVPASNERGGNSGAAYLIDLADLSTEAILLAPDGQAGDRFGDSVALNSEYALIGSPYHQIDNERLGTAYLFNLDKRTLKAKYSDPSGKEGDKFGFSVALNSKEALIGSATSNAVEINAGSAVIINTQTGEISSRLTPTDVHIGQTFGNAVAMNNKYALVGAFHDHAKGMSSGASYLYPLSNTGKAYKLVTGDLKAQDQMGFTVSLGGSHAVIGARHQNNGAENSGGAYLISLP